MANKPIEMKKLRAVLRLHLQGRSKRVIARSCGLAKNTVKKYVELYACLLLSPEELDKLDDKALSELFTQTHKAQTNQRLKDLLSFFPQRTAQNRCDTYAAVGELQSPLLG